MITQHYLVCKQAINTKSAKRGTWFAVRVDTSGDHTTLLQNVDQDAAYAAAQADATAARLPATYIRRLED